MTTHSEEEFQKLVELKVSKAVASAYHAGYEQGYAHGKQAQREQDSEVCPQCGCAEYTPCQTEVTGIETFYRSCDECNHNWRME